MTSDIDARVAETALVLKSIPGGPELLDWCNGRPIFHDAELVELKLNRRRASMSVSTTASGTASHGGMLIKNAVITFTFKDGDMIDVSLQGFSHQNVMGEIWLRFAKPSPVDGSLVGVGLGQGDIEFEIEPCFGAFGTLRATIEKITITPVADYQMADEALSVVK